MLHPHLRYDRVFLSPSSAGRAAWRSPYLGMNTPRNTPPYSFPALFWLWVIGALLYGGRGNELRQAEQRPFLLNSAGEENNN